MPALSSYPACCGASIITGFSSADPSASAGFEIDPRTFNYKLDAKGKRIPITYEAKFLKDLKAQMDRYPGYMYQCVLTQSQLDSCNGAWAKILKKCGFEFARRWTNSVHNGVEFLYLFVLCTDHEDKCEGDFTRPPKGWDELPGPDAVSEPEPTLLQKVKAAVVG